MHFNSKLIFQKYALEYFKDNYKVLEIGPSGYPSAYLRIVNNNTIQWSTLDIGESYIDNGETNPLHISTLDEYNYPINEGTYDIVLAGQVMEHVKSIWKWIDELKRITKKEGYIILISPISWSYHEAPVDCWRIYPEGMKALMSEKGLKIEKNLFESLEKEKYLKDNNTIPGNSYFDLEGNLFSEMKIKSRFNRILTRIPYLRRFTYSIPVAYDNICIVQKQV